MSDQANIVAFGDTRSERIETIWGIAKEKYGTQKASPYTWRTNISKAVGVRCGIRGQDVYNFLTLVGSEKLRELRELCTGETGAPATGTSSIPRPRKKRSDSHPVEVVDAKALKRDVREQYEKALANLSQEAKTRKCLAEAVKKPLFVVDCFLFQNPDFASGLADGEEVFKKSAVSHGP